MPVTITSVLRAAAIALVALGLTVPASAQAPGATAQKENKLKDYERKELESVYSLLDTAITTNAPAGAHVFAIDPSKKEGGVVRSGDATGVKWYNDALRAGDGKTYVPFMVLFDQGPLPAPNAAFAVRVVPKGTTTLTPPAKDGKGGYPWEEIAFGELRPATEVAGGKGQKLARVFQVGPGDYDVYLAMRAHSLEKTKEAPFKAVLIKQPVTLPDLNADLTTSSVIVLDKIEQVTTPLSPAQMREQPWVMGTMQFIPSLDRQFAKTDNFGVYFQVYNQTMQNGKPDVTIEYSFYKKQGTDEKYFNKTAPQTFNASTLPAEWNAAQGHVVQGGWEIPLGNFEAGDYRLEIKVTDNLAKKSITRDVAFSVTGA